MRVIALVFSLAGLLASAEEQRPLDPSKAGDAVVIIDRLTRSQSMPREQAVVLTMAIETLARLVKDNEAKAAEKPVKPKE